MDSSANQLGLLSTNVRSAADLLGQRLEQVTQQIEQAGSQNAAKEKGQVRLEGKEYIMKDGDVTYFRFNV